MAEITPGSSLDSRNPEEHNLINICYNYYKDTILHTPNY